METLFQTFSAETVLIILAVVAPYVCKGINWLYKFKKMKKEAKKELELEIKEELEYEQALEDRFESGEEKMQQTDVNVHELANRIQNAEARLELLTESNKLDIKRIIKHYYDEVQRTKTIDSLELELLNEQYAIYCKEGGNSWAAAMMKTLNQMATYSTIENIKTNKK